MPTSRLFSSYYLPSSILSYSFSMPTSRLFSSYYLLSSRLSYSFYMPTSRLSFCWYLVSSRLFSSYYLFSSRLSYSLYMLAPFVSMCFPADPIVLPYIWKLTDYTPVTICFLAHYPIVFRCQLEDYPLVICSFPSNNPTSITVNASAYSSYSIWYPADYHPVIICYHCMEIW